MSDLDFHVRSTLERTVTAAPPPVPVETIVARATTWVEPSRRPKRRLAFALPVLAAAGAFLAVLAWPTGDGATGPAVGVEATNADPDADFDTRPETATSVAETVAVATVSVDDGQWLSEIIPTFAQQLPNVSVEELWAALDRNEPDQPFAPIDAELESADVPGLTESRLRWEGLLLPTTYSVKADASADEVIVQMHEEFVRTATELGYQDGAEMFDLSPYELVVVASLVESADAVNDGDRARVARVIHNRLAQDLPLGLDPVHVYAAQDRELELTSELFVTPGPYAVRLSPGLPPTPVAAPSAASLRAAINPEPGSWIFYVVADEQGRYAFSTTSDEFRNDVDSAFESGLID